MTNEIAEAALGAVNATNQMDLIHIIMDGGPMWPHVVFMVWLLLLPIAPLLSIILCIRSWRNRRKGKTGAYTKPAILSLALLTFSLASVHAIEGFRSALYYVTGTTTIGPQMASMVAVNIAHECWILMGGIASAVVCLLCTLWLPRSNPCNENSAGRQGAGR